VIKTDASELRHVVVDEPLSEYDVHPAQTYESLRRCARQSVEQLTAAARDFIDVACPGCNTNARSPAFDKHGLRYWRCKECWTIYVSPRPNPEQMRWYFQQSPYAEYRRAPAFAEHMPERALELAAFRADWIHDIRTTHAAPRSGALVDVHARSLPLLAAMSARAMSPLFALRPHVSIPAGAAVSVVEHARELPAQCAVMLLFDVIEGVSDLDVLISALAERLGTGGLLALTTRSGSGLDVQTLQGGCPTVFPADHLTLLSVEGSRALALRHGFRVLELSTPGQLDVQVLERTLAAHSERLDRGDATEEGFLHYFFKHRGAEAKARLQRFLQQTQTSSHVRLVAQRLPR
jgi:hypothetical protein